MWVTTYFNDSVGPATGLTPTICIRDVETGTVVVSGTMTEISRGFYKFELFGYDITKDYTVLCDSVTLPSAYRYKGSSSGEWGNIINNIGLVSDNVDFRVNLVRKIWKNRLILKDGGVQNLTVYEDDDVTPVIKWDVTDLTDDLISQGRYNSSRRTRGA